VGKIGNVLTMLKILENGQKYTVKELAERLEVSKRMIKIYKSELEKAGIYIETLYGPYGGYVYNHKNNYDIEFNYSDIDNIENILNKLYSIKKLLRNKKIKMPIINLIYDIIVNEKEPSNLTKFLIEKE
jgi:predicted DNA-binding transcriptional regulator YafY